MQYTKSDNSIKIMIRDRPKSSLDDNSQEQLILQNQSLMNQVEQFKELYYQQKYYFQCQQEQFADLQNKYENSVTKVSELQEQLNNQEQTEQTQLCVSLLQDLQGLEYLVNKMKLLIPNQQALQIINQIQKTYEQLRNRESSHNEQQIYHKLLQALDKKLNEQITQNKENCNTSQNHLKIHVSQKLNQLINM